MGNTLRRLYEECYSPRPEGGHGVSPGTAGFDALARDLFQFENTGQVPEGLSQHLEASKKTQATWYNKIQAAWKEEPPKNAEQAATLIVRALHKHHKVNVEGLLAFYGLPYPAASVQIPEQTLQKWPVGVKFELHSLQVDARAVADGDTITVYVDTKKPRESSEVPVSVQKAAMERREARTRRDYVRADALQNQIADAGYRVFDGARNGDDILSRKYRIRLRGVDAPESKMPYGKEAKEALLNLIEGKSLHILVYEQDRYGRSVGDVYCGNIFVQEVLLKRGFAWHYSQYDQRPEFAEWQKEAQAARVGLWASSNPQKPWEWRKDKREGVPIATFA
ncbi:hypothetical protein SUGI_0784500 [Cryptomeria japonica]|uniref:uncharacterized 38.1 kDa protein n=1 Tax=Cryptomeria japonica TaxID=3369 RepID=UPI002414CC92|nr:uncharacterized 38.1 kDa protein [Cryptomeria japonica]GLJ38499.1 hypothetical protein SUGI_0784500 [Cryptomeria japonica]